MKVVAVFSLISIIMLSGCAAQVVKTDMEEKVQPPETETPSVLPKPQVTSGEETKQETQINTTTTIEVTKTPEEQISEEPSEPRTFHIDVIQGIGIREGAG